MKCMNRVAMIVAVAGLASPALAQDSVSKNGTSLPGDGLNPWAAGEQISRYVIDTDVHFGSWGTAFDVAPLAKSSSTNPTMFSGSLLSANAHSSTLSSNVATNQDPYGVWLMQPGAGVNPTQNDAPGTLDIPPFMNQFAIGMIEFSTDAAGGDHNGTVGAIANYNPFEEGRLWVKRVMAANNQPAPGAGDNAQVGGLSVDSDGNLYIRSDDFGLTGPSPLLGQNITRVRMDDRTPGVLNVFQAGGANDASDWLVQSSATTHSPGNAQPSTVVGGNGNFLGSNFNGDLVSGAGFPQATTGAHIISCGVNGYTGTRGTIAYTHHNFAAPVMSRAGTGAVLSRGANDVEVDAISLFGLDSIGGVTGNTCLILPNTLVDVCEGWTLTSANPSTGTIIGDFHFDHYHSQTSFRGGVSQIALGVDPHAPMGKQGLAAAVIYDDEFGNFDNPLNSIAVARFNEADPTDYEWELAAWIDANRGGPFAVPGSGQTLGAAGGLVGKLIQADYGNDGIAFTGDAGEFDGVIDLDPSSPTHDAAHGCLTNLDAVTGGAPFGPSMSAPGMDSAGNIYFISAVELLKADSKGMVFTDTDSALLRAIHVEDCDPVTPGNQPGWLLEKVVELGQTFDGQNSGLRYQLQFSGVADSNSIDSGTMFSTGVSDVAWNNRNPATFAKTDPRVLGGLIIRADIAYDVDGNGSFDEAAGTDESYNVALWFGSLPCLGDINTTGTTNGIPDGDTNLSDLQFFLTAWQNDLGMTPASIADVTTTGSAVGTANFGLSDGDVNLSDLQFFLTAWQNCFGQ